MPYCGWVSVDRLPRIFVEPIVEAGKNGCALRQRRNRIEQVGGRRNRAGRTGGDHRISGRFRPPRGGLRFDNAVAVLGGIERFLFGENSRPRIGEDLEEFERQLPMFGILLRRDFFEIGEIAAFDLHLDRAERRAHRQAAPPDQAASSGFSFAPAARAAIAAARAKWPAECRNRTPVPAQNKARLRRYRRWGAGAAAAPLAIPSRAEKLRANDGRRGASAVAPAYPQGGTDRVPPFATNHPQGGR